jgi:hypothetical protein
MGSHNKKAQAVVELAIFGSIILFVFGVLLSFMQRFNDQQYVQMEAFRRALEKGCTYSGETSEGAGASVQYTLITDRRHVDLSGGFRKGSPTTLSASSNVFWAVPKVGAQSESLIAYRINEDERTRNYSDLIPADAGDDQSFVMEPTLSASRSSFRETVTKEESGQAITNSRESSLSEEKAIIIPYTIRPKDDYDDNHIIRQGTFWEGQGTVLSGYGSAWDGQEALVQRLYRDNSGQYKYSSRVPEGAAIERSKTWVTER